MFWKYWFAVLLCCLIAWFVRKFLCTKEYRSSEEERIPRIWTFLLILIGFVPIVNYVLGAAMIVILVTAAIDGDLLYMREEPFKNKKLQKWLLGKD